MTVAATTPDLRERAGTAPDSTAWALGITDVTVVCSSSRGGSSVLFRAISQSTEILSPRGEETPFVRSSIRAVMVSVDDTLAGDAVTEGELDVCRAAFAGDVGVGTAIRHTDDLDRYIADLALRLPWQWADLTPAIVTERAHRLAADRRGAWLSGAGWDAVALFRELIDDLSRLSAVDPRYYDDDPLLGGPLVQGDAPSGPPVLGSLAEEPPFIPILPRRRPSVGAPTRLLLKAPASCYRLDLLHSIFPMARIKVLHLVRNPAATVNGLIDGWRHWGFFSRDVASLGAELDIAGYSDLFPWGHRWWNFDLPPGWRDRVGDPLERVCAYQWSSCHLATDAFVERTRPDYLRIAFEDLTGDPERRRRTLARAAEFAGVRNVEACSGELPGVVMSTVPPSPGRWRRRESMILDALADPEVRELAERFGYSWRRRDAWT